MLLWIAAFEIGSSPGSESRLQPAQSRSPVHHTIDPWYQPHGVVVLGLVVTCLPSPQQSQTLCQPLGMEWTRCFFLVNYNMQQKKKKKGYEWEKGAQVHDFCSLGIGQAGGYITDYIHKQRIHIMACENLLQCFVLWGGDPQYIFIVLSGVGLPFETGVCRPTLQMVWTEMSDWYWTITGTTTLNSDHGAR